MRVTPFDTISILDRPYDSPFGVNSSIRYDIVRDADTAQTNSIALDFSNDLLGSIPLIFRDIFNGYF